MIHLLNKRYLKGVYGRHEQKNPAGETKDWNNNIKNENTEKPQLF